MRQRWATIERKLHRAEEKRQSQLKIKAKKAHEEEAKVTFRIFRLLSFCPDLRPKNFCSESRHKFQH